MTESTAIPAAAMAGSSCQLAFLCLPRQPAVANPILPYWRPIMALSWTFAYIIYIFGSQRHSEYRGVPFAAMVLNLAWEYAFSFVWTKGQTTPQLIIHYIWLGFDVLLAIQYARFKWKNICRYWIWYFLLTVTLGSFLVVFIQEIRDYTGTYMAFLQNLVMSILFVKEALNMDEAEEESASSTVALTTKNTSTSSSAAKTTTGTGDQGHHQQHHSSPHVFVVGTAAVIDPWTSWIAGFLRLIGTTAASVAIFEVTHDPSQKQHLMEQPLLPFLFVGCFVWDILYVYITFNKWKRMASYRQQHSPPVKAHEY